MSNEITINESHHIGGVPAVGSGVEINFGSISIGLNKEDYQKLAEVISESVGKNLTRLTELYDRYWEDTKKNGEFIQAFRGIFYASNDEGDFFFKREIKDIDADRLQDLLNLYSDFLGLE